MSVSLEDVSSVKKVLHVEVPQDEVKRKLDEAYRDLNKRVKLKGFRPGKIPRNVLKRLYKKDVVAEVSQKMIQDTLIAAVQENNLRMVGKPDINQSDLDESAPFTYDATLEITPDIPDLDYADLKLTKNIYPVTDKEIDAQLRMLQKKVAELKPISDQRPVREGDFVVIDYEATQDGSPFELIGSSENHAVEIGKGDDITPEMEQAIIGKTPGEETDVHVDFPENYDNKDLAGQSVDFKIAVKEIREEILPPIDDEMAKNFGPFESIDALKDTIRANLQQGYDRRAQQELNEQVFSALLAQIDFEVPEALVSSELDAIVADFRRQIETGDITMEQFGITPEKIKADHREAAFQQVRRSLLLGKLIEQMNLELSDQELEVHFQAIAKQNKQSVEDIRQHYKKNPDNLAYLKHAALEKQALALIIEQSEVSQVQVEQETNPEPAAESAAE